MDERTRTDRPGSQFISGLKVTTAIVVLGGLFAFGDRAYVSSQVSDMPAATTPAAAPLLDGFRLPDELRIPGNEPQVAVATF